MFVCRLFHQDRPFEQLEARLIEPGVTAIGRDPAADWMIGRYDPTLSRVHCVLELENGRLFLCDQSTNGAYVDGRRAPQGERLEVAVRQSVALGSMVILIDQVAQNSADDVSATSPGGVMVAQDWLDPAMGEPTSSHRDASLLDAFFEGAKLDASALSSEDPVDLMRRAGAIYQQTVLALAALMAERARMKSEHQLDSTTISAGDNNPFKWTPSRKLAEDLLRRRETGFLGDGDAVRASFGDIGRHLGGVREGAAAVAQFAIQQFDPAGIDVEARAQGGLLRNHSAVCWEVFLKRYAVLTGDENAGLLKRIFADAYNHAAEAGTDNADHRAA